MNHEQVQQILKGLPSLLAGALVGVVLVYGMGRFPVLIEVNWGAEENRVKFDSRTEQWCPDVSINT